tara:strand:- start:90 stop:236 length:147 start_codon:yes stop_codon:yes gene_type:complete
VKVNYAPHEVLGLLIMESLRIGLVAEAEEEAEYLGRLYKAWEEDEMVI